MSAFDKSALTAPLPRIHKEHGFLSTDENEALVSYVVQREAHFAPTTVMSKSGESPNLGHRSSRKLVSQADEWKSSLRNHFAKAFPRAIEATGVSIETFDHIELEIVSHNDGDRFGRHIDTLYYGAAGDHKSCRFLSAVYYFFREPRMFSGGELMIYPFGAPDSGGREIKLIPENNMAVFFPSFAVHEVLMVACPTGDFRDSRFAVNCWFHSKLSR